MAEYYIWTISNVPKLKRMVKKSGTAIYCARCGTRLITSEGENVARERILQFSMEEVGLAGFTHDSCAYGVDRDSLEEDVKKPKRQKKTDYFSQAMARLRAAKRESKR